MEKKAYEAPAITVHGSVEDLTKGGGIGFTDLLVGNGIGSVFIPEPGHGGSDLGS